MFMTIFEVIGYLTKENKIGLVCLLTPFQEKNFNEILIKLFPPRFYLCMFPLWASPQLKKWFLEIMHILWNIYFGHPFLLL